MKILIVGSGAKEYTLAKIFSGYNSVDTVFVAPGNDAIGEFANCIDIKANNTDELLEFAKINEIDLTVASSEQAVMYEIAEKFNEAGLLIFSPTAAASRICTSKSTGKKFMYKTKIQTPKFGVFDRENIAVDYARRSKYPLLLKTDNHLPGENTIVCNSFKEAKRKIEDSFSNFNKKIVLEDFVEGPEFSYYIITDGYNAMPLMSVVPYKYNLDGNGGLITSGTGAYAPFYMLDTALESRIFKEIVYPVLDSLAKNKTNYVGILGIDIILDKDKQLNVLEFNSFLQEPDAQCILKLLDCNLINLMKAAIAGSLADDYTEIPLKSGYAASAVLTAGNYPSNLKKGSIIYGLEEAEEEDVEIAHFKTRKNIYSEYETLGGRAIAVTGAASTLGLAVDKVYEAIQLINFDGMKYRTDIGKRIPAGIL